MSREWDIARWEKELDEWFSKFVRLSRADWKGEVQCYTCLERGDWKGFDCGHFIRRGILILRWEEDNARPQCQTCNRHMDGRYDVFEEELRDELGDTRVEEMLSMKPTISHFGPDWFEDEVIHYKSLVDSMLTAV